MKKIILGIVIGFIIGVGVTVGASILYSAKDIEYSNPKSTKENVQDALIEITDDLLENEAILLWTNPNIINSFPAQTLNLDLSKYEYVMIDQCYTISTCYVTDKNIIKVGNMSGVYSTYSMDNTYVTWRKAWVNNNGIQFSTGYFYNGNQLDNNEWAIPYHIWGIKHLTIK